MDIELKSKIDVFNDTYNEMRKNFKYDGKKSNVMKALLAFSNDSGFDIDRVKEIRKYLFSFKFDLFRFRYRKIISMLIYDSEDYKKLYDSSKGVYDNLIAKGLSKNDFTVSLAVILTKNFEGDKLNKILDKVISLKDNLNCIDNRYDVLLALADKEIKDVYHEFEMIKEQINCVDGYSISISKILASSIIISNDKVEEKVENMFSLICNIKGNLGKIPEESLIFIGIASLLVEDSEVFSKELKTIYGILNENKNIIKKDYIKYNLLISLLILICKYIEEAKAGIIEAKINNNYLDIIQDYVICLMYFI